MGCPPDLPLPSPGDTRPLPGVSSFGAHAVHYFVSLAARPASTNPLLKLWDNNGPPGGRYYPTTLRAANARAIRRGSPGSRRAAGGGAPRTPGHSLTTSKQIHKTRTYRGVKLRFRGRGQEWPAVRRRLASTPRGNGGGNGGGDNQRFPEHCEQGPCRPLRRLYRTGNGRVPAAGIRIICRPQARDSRHTSHVARWSLIDPPHRAADR
jgi:hypothetical protein